MLYLDHGHDALGIRVLPPGHHGFALEVVLHQPEEVGELPSSILIQVVLSGYKSDSLEDFHPEGFTGDGTDGVDGVLLLLDIISPNKKDISSFVDILVVLDSSNEGAESLIPVLLGLLLESHLVLDLLVKLLRFKELLLLLMLPSLSQISPLLLLGV